MRPPNFGYEARFSDDGIILETDCEAESLSHFTVTEERDAEPEAITFTGDNANAKKTFKAYQVWPTS